MIRTARPGVIIGTNGENVEMLKKKVEKLTGGKNIYLKVLEIANPDLDAKLVARSIAVSWSSVLPSVLHRRRLFRERCVPEQRVSKLPYPVVWAELIWLVPKAIAKVLYLCTHCVRISITLGKKHLRTYGRLGVKVWICRGEVLPGTMVQEPEASENNMNDRRRNRRGNRGGNRNNSQRNNNNRNSAGGNAPRKAEGGK